LDKKNPKGSNRWQKPTSPGIIGSLDDPEAAEAAAKYLLADLDQEEKDVSTNSPRGRKRGKSIVSGHKVHPIPGVKREETSIRIREIQALRYAGFTDSMIAKRLGVHGNYVWELENQYPEAFEFVRAEILKSFMRDYSDGLVMVAGAIGRIGLQSTAVLAKEMRNYTDGTPQSRIKAAELLVKLLAGASMIPQKAEEETLAASVANKVKEAMADREEYIDVTAEEEPVEFRVGASGRGVRGDDQGEDRGDIS